MGFKLWKFITEINLTKRVILYLFFLALVGLGLHSYLPYKNHIRYALEALLIFGMLCVLAGYKPLVAKFWTTDPFYKSVVIVFLAMLLAGQLADKNTFPFVAWAMYGSRQNKENVVCYKYFGKLQDGSIERFVPAGAISTLANDRIDTKLRNQIKAINNEENPDQQAALIKEHEATLIALARLYNRERPANPILAIEISECIVPLNTYEGISSIKRQFLWEIKVKQE